MMVDIYTCPYCGTESMDHRLVHEAMQSGDELHKVQICSHCNKEFIIVFIAEHYEDTNCEIIEVDI